MQHYLHRYAIISAIVVSTCCRPQYASSFHTTALTVHDQRTYTHPFVPTSIPLGFSTLNAFCNRKPFMRSTVLSPEWISPRTNAFCYTVLASSLLTDDDSAASQLEPMNFDAGPINNSGFPIQDADGIYEIGSKEQHL